MAKPTLAPKSQGMDPRLYCDYARLVRLQAQAESFSLLPHLKRVAYSQAATIRCFAVVD